MSSTHHDIKGLISALLVPFTAEGKINEKGLRQIVPQSGQNAGGRLVRRRLDRREFHA